MAGERYMMFQRAKRYLRGHPQAADAEVADAVGAKLAFADERDVIAAARRELENDSEIPRLR